MQRYDLGETLFVSGRSTFYLGRNVILGSEVVVRRLDPDPARPADQRETFFREQRHIAALRHPHIMKTLDVFEEDGALWSVHPYVPSRPTDDIVEEDGPFALADAARIASHVADALSYLHERGFVHGRVDPGFVLLEERGETILTNLVKSADLAAGIWPLREAVRGLGPFTSPEELAGAKPTAQSDLFGLARVFLFWLTASVEGVEEFARTLRETADVAGPLHPRASPFPQLPVALVDALDGALQPDPARRRGSTAALAAHFSELHSRHAAEVPAGFDTGTVLQAKGFPEPMELIGRVGSGRFGVVLRARSATCGSALAVKVLKPEHRDDPLVAERFLREARALQHIRHENVVRVHGIGEVRDLPFLVMDYLDGPTLGTHLRRNGMLGAPEATAVALGIARGLSAIHEAALLHRDLKPDNVMLVGGKCPVITDLGVAKSLREEGLTMSGALVGTPLYMAPEQAWGKEVGPAADLYALGAILYECLGGAPPHRSTDLVALLNAVRGAVPDPLPDDVPRSVVDLVARLLRKDPSQRPPDAASVAGELEGIVAALR